ncbi:MAG: tubulin-like doman-containing protein, partial [Phycisphaerales bacterium]
MRLSNSPIVVRPTLIVGLGGTGVLVCQWAEHYIRELFGHVPSFIRFLKLDTDASDDGGPPEGILSDFINLFHHVDVGEVVRDNASFPEFHPHLDWMRGFREDATFADYGCQGIPRLGRLVFFELRETIVHEAVATRFSSLRTSTQQIVEEQPDQFILASDGAPAVHIASSVCGGTGAGMLIDMAYNLRWWSRESFPKPAEVIGHLLLPDAFRVDPMLRPKLEATASATLDQIEFLSDERRPDIRVRYRSDRAGEDCFRRDTGPFNFLYLLNGQVDMGSGDRKHLVRQIARVI